MSDKNFNKLQRIQNRAARIGRRQQNARQLCHNLHWLPVYSRTDFKLATLCFKSHVMWQLDYLAVTLDRYEPSRSLRSSTQHFLPVPFCNTVLGKRRFSVAASLVWNSLPLDLRTANSLPVFKNNVKTFLFLCHRVPLITGLSSWFWRYINFIISISKQYNQHEYVEKIWPYDQTNGTNNRQTDRQTDSVASHSINLNKTVADDSHTQDSFPELLLPTWSVFVGYVRAKSSA